jgi:hypothetical protein
VRCEAITSAGTSDEGKAADEGMSGGLLVAKGADLKNVSEANGPRPPFM